MNEHTLNGLVEAERFAARQHVSLEEISEEMRAARVAEAKAQTQQIKNYFRGYLDGLAYQYVLLQELA